MEKGFSPELMDPLAMDFGATMKCMDSANRCGQMVQNTKAISSVVLNTVRVGMSGQMEASILALG